MTRPFLSIVIPTFNEASGIAACVDAMRQELTALPHTWEIVVSDDGSRDQTRAIVERIAAEDPRVRLVAAPHQGKGAALRRGLTAADGDWRFICDADLSMPPDNLRRFLDRVVASADRRDGMAQGPDIVVGSREAPGSQRVGESWMRHVIGRVFNWVVRALAVRGIRDTQCGYKLLSARAVAAVAPQLTLDGFAFDVELLRVARRAGLAVREVGIVWNCRTDSRVGLGRGAAAFVDVLRVRWRHRDRMPRARVGAYTLAGILAVGVAYDLWRMPVQVHDALTEIVEAEASPSVAASFRGALGSNAYLRPLRIAEIKALLDAGGARPWRVYRGFHAVLLIACILLFTRALRVQTSSDLAAAAAALLVLTGMHTFVGTVREAFPFNHFLQIAVCCLIALNLAQSRGGWLADIGAALTLVVAALTIESGVLVWVVVAAAWIAGLRGVSGRGLAAMTTLLAAYFYVRFVHLSTGMPSYLERSSGYLLERLDPPQLEALFHDRVPVLYAYNVAASALSVLFSEPQNGVFIAVRAWLKGDVPASAFVALGSSIPTTVLLLWAGVSMWRASARHDPRFQMLFVATGVIAASTVLSFAYTKDEILSTAGVFYALAAYAALRWLFERGPARGWAPAIVAVMLAGAGSLWATRSLGLHHILTVQASNHRNDWAHMQSVWQRDDRWPTDPRQVTLILRLRHDALTRRAPNRALKPGWTDRLWGD